MMFSYDKLCHLSMELCWTDRLGQEQSWDSWTDALCGWYAAMRLLPWDSTNIRVLFKSHPGGHKLKAVDRRNHSTWKSEDEVILLRHDLERGVDAHFCIRGPLMRCYVWRAWNARNGGCPEDWEHWPDCPIQPPQAPNTIQAADRVAPWTFSRIEQDATVVLANAMVRLRTASEYMLAVRKHTHEELQLMNKNMQKQWLGVNSTNTVAAGLAVGSFATVFFVPPVGIALGAAGVAVGVSATGGDIGADSRRSSRIATAFQEDFYEQLGFETIEAELRVALESATTVSELDLNRIGSSVAVGFQTAKIAEVALTTASRFSRSVTLARAPLSGVSVAGAIVGGVGAGLAVGVAIHGWATKKPNHKMVKERLVAVKRSIDYLSLMVQQVDGAMDCPVCNERLDFTSSGMGSLVRCQNYHCFHTDCVRDGDARRASTCPLCPRDTGGRLRALCTTVDQLRALLWQSGIRPRSLGLDFVAPHLVAQAREFVKEKASISRNLSQNSLLELISDQACEVRFRTKRNKAMSMLSEDGATHELWQEAIEEAGSLSDIEETQLEQLLAKGMPLKYRFACWPRWLRVADRRATVEASGRTYGSLSSTDLPEEVRRTIDADILRTPELFLLVGQEETMRKVLTAVAAYNTDVGYSQGMAHIATVFLKLGFEAEDAFWMLLTIFGELVPDCHAQDLHGLFRDTAVADVLLNTFAPSVAGALSSTNQLLWLATEYFLALGTKRMPLAVVVRLWDLCFLHGPRAIFAGFLASLQLYFPSGDGTLELDSMMAFYSEALMASDPEAFCNMVLDLLHERQGGVSAGLVLALRAMLGQEGVRLETLPPNALSQGRDFVASLVSSTKGLRGLSHDDILDMLAPEAPEVSDGEDGPVARTGDCRPSDTLLLEEPGAHESWLDAVGNAGSLDAVPRHVVEGLLASHGMPLKYRHALWPAWLRVDEQKTAVPDGSYDLWAATELRDLIGQRVLEEIAKVGSRPLGTKHTTALSRILVALAAEGSPTCGDVQCAGDIAAVFLELGFEEECVFWMLVGVLVNLVQECHSSDLAGLWRDTAVAGVLVQTFLPSHTAAAYSGDGRLLLRLCGEYFLALLARRGPLSSVVRLWDLLFFHGPCALFAGFLCHVELFLPSDSTMGLDGTPDSTAMLSAYRSACSDGDAHVIATRLLDFLHERQGGVSEELVQGLRAVFQKQPLGCSPWRRPVTDENSLSGCDSVRHSQSWQDAHGTCADEELSSQTAGQLDSTLSFPGLTGAGNERVGGETFIAD